MPLPPLVEPAPVLSADEAGRTRRHTSLAALGDAGQRRLRAAHVAVVGAGGLGSPAVLALAAAGVGTLTVIDDDTVDLSNLQRQVLHTASDLGRPKVDSAVRAAAGLSPETRVLARRERLTAANAAALLSGADVVLDGSDTFDTREAVAAACEHLAVPLVWGAVQETAAQVTVFWSAPPPGIPPVVLGDLYPPGSAGDAPTCEAVGVLGPLCLQTGALMATEALKLLTGIGEPLLGRVLLVDALRARTREVPLGAARAMTSPTGRAETAASDVPFLSPGQLRERVAAGEPLAVLDVREIDEAAADPMPGARVIPLAALLAEPSVAPDPVVLVCAAGARALTAARALRARGTAASVLAGGMRAWHAKEAE